MQMRWLRILASLQQRDATSTTDLMVVNPRKPHVITHQQHSEMIPLKVLGGSHEETGVAAVDHWQGWSLTPPPPSAGAGSQLHVSCQQRLMHQAHRFSCVPPAAAVVSAVTPRTPITARGRTLDMMLNAELTRRIFFMVTLQ